VRLGLDNTRSGFRFVAVDGADRFKCGELMELGGIGGEKWIGLERALMGLEVYECEELKVCGEEELMGLDGTGDEKLMGSDGTGDEELEGFEDKELIRVEWSGSKELI
jgi:hypothetical protein